MERRTRRGHRCLSAGRFTARLALSWLMAGATIQSTEAVWTPGWQPPADIGQLAPNLAIHTSKDAMSNYPSKGDLEFSLRHVFLHGLHQNPHFHKRRDIDPNEAVRLLSDDGEVIASSAGPFTAKSQKTLIHRLSDRSISHAQNLYQEARYTGTAASLEPSAWTLDEVSGPNITDQDTVVNMAKMAWCAYTEIPGTSDWPELGPGFNETQGFGWKGDNLRGHIFANKDNSTIVVAIKGTSPAFWDGAETTTNDKINDNLFFGCCCGQGGHLLWRSACSCKTSTYTCNQTCLVSALKQENRYYSASIDLYGNVTELYPDSEIWLVGHSLGGSTSSLLGLTFGVPTVTFEAPGDALAATRLGLPAPPGSMPGVPQTREYTGAVHFGHTADPIFMGTCNAVMSACTLGGYSLQTQCHTGAVCRYDTVGDFGWRVGIGYHKIKTVIDDVLEKYDHPPSCFPDDECVDCFNWKFYESNGTETSTTTSSTSTSSPTRTATCKTPGWWGCLDETTTTTSTSTSTTTGPTTSCLKYGWFGGCLETTTITPTSTPVETTTLTTTSCAKDGWFGGCVETTTFLVTTTTPVEKHPKMWTTTCAVSGWFWGCASTATIPLLPTDAPKPVFKCVKHNLWGWGWCVSRTTIYPTPTPSTPAHAPAPTITTTRPITTSRTRRTSIMTPTAAPNQDL